MHTADDITVSRERIAAAEVVSVTGELDVASAPVLRAELDGIVLEGDSAPSSVLVDLSGVPFLDSTALGVLVGALRRTQDVGVAFAVVVTHPHVRKVLEVTRLVDLMTVHPDRATALAAG